MSLVFPPSSLHHTHFLCFRIIIHISDTSCSPLYPPHVYGHMFTLNFEFCHIWSFVRTLFFSFFYKHLLCKNKNRNITKMQPKNACTQETLSVSVYADSYTDSIKNIYIYIMCQFSGFRCQVSCFACPLSPDACH